MPGDAGGDRTVDEERSPGREAESEDPERGTKWELPEGCRTLFPEKSESENFIVDSAGRSISLVLCFLRLK